MRRIGLHTFAAAAFMAIAIPLAGQNAPCLQTTPCPVNPPKQLSFTAEIKSHNVQTLADGTTITSDSKELQARDSQGRFMTSRTGPFSPGNSPNDAFISANANDPVDGMQANWNSRTRKATVIKMPPNDERHGCWVNGSGTMHMNFGPKSPQPPPRTSGSSGGVGTGSGSEFPASAPLRPLPPRPSREDLGTTVIMGLEAHGTRMTTTTPIGEIGNDKPLVRTSEVWTAPGLFIPLRQITTDPRTGTQTREVVSLDLSDPPLSTFQPPEGYEITVDEMHEVPCQPPLGP